MSPWHPAKILKQCELKRLFAVIETKRDRACFSSRTATDCAPRKLACCEYPTLILPVIESTCHRLKKEISAIHPLQPDEIKTLESYLRHRADHDNPVLFSTNRVTPRSRPAFDRALLF